MTDQDQDQRAPVRALADARKPEPAVSMHMSDLAQECIDTIDDLAVHGPRKRRAGTGLSDLSEVIGGMEPGHLIAVASRPGVGKTSLVFGFARHCAIRQSLPTLIVAPEQPRNDTMTRLVAAEASIRVADVRLGLLDDDGWTRLAKRLNLIVDAPLYVDDTPRVSVDHIRREADAVKRDCGKLGLVVVDGLHNVDPPRLLDNPHQETTETSRALKALARELHVPVVVTAQLPRTAAPVPTLGDFRGCGSLDQDADVAMVLERIDLHERDHPRAGEADVRILKHRLGPAPTVVPVAHLLHYGRFGDLA